LGPTGRDGISTQEKKSGFRDPIGSIGILGSWNPLFFPLSVPVRISDRSTRSGSRANPKNSADGLCNFFFLYSFLREEIEVTDEMGDDIDLADLVPKVYEPILSWDVLQTKLINSMNKMNEEIRGSNMDLVFFKDAMIHLLRVRILRSCVFEIEFYDLSIDFTGY